MKYRRRQRWLRRLALGLAAATVAVLGAGPASAKPGEHAAGTRYVTGQGGAQVIPYLSHGILTQEQAGTVVVPSGDELAFRSVVAPQPATRPDDRADRFMHSDVAPRVELASSRWWEIEREVVFAAGLGLALGLGLILGIAVGVRRGPKLAGH